MAEPRPDTEVSSCVREDVYFFDEQGNRVDLGACAVAAVQVGDQIYTYTCTMPPRWDEFPELRDATLRLAEAKVMDRVRRDAGRA